MNLIERLHEAFGESASKLDVSSVAPSWAAMDCGPLALVIDEKARLFVKCGGDVIAKVPTLSTGTTMVFYVVRDDTEGQAWMAWLGRHQRGEVEFESTYYHGGRPSAVLKVIASG